MYSKVRVPERAPRLNLDFAREARRLRAPGPGLQQGSRVRFPRELVPKLMINGSPGEAGGFRE
jgi:hypothetical protein